MCVFNTNDKVRPRERAVMWEGSFMSAKKTLTVAWYSQRTEKVAFRETGDSNLFDAMGFVLHKPAPMTGQELETVAECIRSLVKSSRKHPQDINSGDCAFFADNLVDLMAQSDLHGLAVDAGLGECMHTFVQFKGRYFDAEALYGQSNMWALPTFIRAGQEDNNKEIKRIWAKN